MLLAQALHKSALPLLWERYLNARSHLTAHRTQGYPTKYEILTHLLRQMFAVYGSPQSLPIEELWLQVQLSTYADHIGDNLHDLEQFLNDERLTGQHSCSLWHDACVMAHASCWHHDVA